MSGLVDNIRASLLGLRMPRALEMLDHTVQRLEKGEIGAIEAIDGLLSEEFNCREDRRVGVALTTARLTPPKTLESFDFTFQPSLDRDRIMALAQLDFVTRAEVVQRLARAGRVPDIAVLAPPSSPGRGSIRRRNTDRAAAPSVRGNHALWLIDATRPIEAEDAAREFR